MTDTWIDLALAREGLTPRILDTLRDVARHLHRRKLPQPGSSVVYDACYDTASAKGWIVWTQVDPNVASIVNDRYILTSAGFQILARQSTASRKLAGSQ